MWWRRVAPHPTVPTRVVTPAAAGDSCGRRAAVHRSGRGFDDRVQLVRRRRGVTPGRPAECGQAGPVTRAVLRLAVGGLRVHDLRWVEHVAETYRVRELVQEDLALRRAGTEP